MSARGLSLRMARSVLLVPLALGLAHGACDVARERTQTAQKPAESRLLESVYLDEWLPLGSSRCRVTRTEERLSEPTEVTAGHVPPDIRVLAVHTECVSESDLPLSLEGALPGDVLIFLRDHAGTRSAPSTRTKLSTLDAAPLVFEIPAGVRPLPARRTFEVRSGRALHQAADRDVRLSFEASGERREVVLRHRALEVSFDAWLSELVNTLLVEGDTPASSALAAKDLGRARKLYRALVERFEPTRVTLTDLELADDLSLTASLTLERPRVHDAPNPVAVLRFRLPAKRGASFADASLLNVTDGQATIECADKARALRARVSQQTSGARSDKSAAPSERCNVLGLSLPERCERLAPPFKDEALALQTRCSPSLGAMAETTREWARTAPERVAIPSEFQVTLRRGRRNAGFDHGARYVLSLYGNGAVVFHGKSFVNGTGRSDGRTSLVLAQAIVERLVSLRWFERRGGEWHADRCSLEDDRGDVFTVRINGRERMVLDRDGCRGPFTPSELTDLRGLLELTTGVVGWTEPSAEWEADQVSEWTVSAD